MDDDMASPEWQKPATKGELAMVIGQTCIALQMASTALIAVYRGDKDRLLERVEAVNAQSQALFDLIARLKAGADE